MVRVTLVLSTLLPSYLLSPHLTVIQLARLSGFSPIITTASLRNTELLLSLGATHVLDRTLPSETLQAEAKRVAGCAAFELVYDAISLPETLALAYALTATHGDLVLVLPAKEIQEAAAKDSDMKRVHVVLGVMSVPCNVDVATSLLENLPKLLESGKIRVRPVEYGLAIRPYVLTKVDFRW